MREPADIIEEMIDNGVTAALREELNLTIRRIAYDIAHALQHGRVKMSRPGE